MLIDWCPSYNAPTPWTVHICYTYTTHIILSSDQLRAASLIGRNAVTWLWALSNVGRFTTIYRLTFSPSSDIFTLRENVGWSDSLDGVLTYSNADIVCHSATCRTELKERNSVRQIEDSLLMSVNMRCITTLFMIKKATVPSSQNLENRRFNWK